MRLQEEDLDESSSGELGVCSGVPENQLSEPCSWTSSRPRALDCAAFFKFSSYLRGRGDYEEMPNIAV